MASLDAVENSVTEGFKALEGQPIHTQRYTEETAWRMMQLWET